MVDHDPSRRACSRTQRRRLTALPRCGQRKLERGAMRRVHSGARAGRHALRWSTVVPVRPYHQLARPVVDDRHGLDAVHHEVDDHLPEARPANNRPVRGHQSHPKRRRTSTILVLAMLAGTTVGEPTEEASKEGQLDPDYAPGKAAIAAK